MTDNDELSPLQRRMQLGPRVDPASVETTPRPTVSAKSTTDKKLWRKNFVLPHDIMEEFLSRIDGVYHASRGKYMKRDIAAAIIKAGNDVADDRVIHELLSDISQNDQ